MKPVIVYVDDEPHNLTVFEASLPEDWKVHLFESAVEALKTLKQIDPWVIVSDQRMPMMTGLEFLEVAKQLVPDAVRMVVTGQTAEQTMIQLIRRANIFDYVTKPWDTEDLCARVEGAIALNRAVAERKEFLLQLEQKVRELERTNLELAKVSQELSATRQREQEFRAELEKWVPAQIVNAVKEGELAFPMRKEIVGITFDIVDSSRLHEEEIFERPLRAQILRLFTESVIRNGGIRESSSGDSAYAHFGAFFLFQDPFLSALSAAREFRVALRNLASLSGRPLECGIALHRIPDTIIQIHEVKVSTPHGEFIQKSFDTQSLHIDLLHRMEKLTHDLPGSNIIMSDEFRKSVTQPFPRIVNLGRMLFKGQREAVDLHLLPSDLVSDEALSEFIARNFGAMTNGTTDLQTAA